MKEGLRPIRLRLREAVLRTGRLRLMMYSWPNPHSGGGAKGRRRRAGGDRLVEARDLGLEPEATYLIGSAPST